MRRTTKVTAVVIMPVLTAAWAVLYLFPGRTTQLWAWTIRPDMTAVTLGAGYLGGAWFFWRVATSDEPRRVVGGLAAAAVFTTMLGVATFLHWDRFNHDHVSFWAWLFLYTVSPPLLPVLAWANHRAAARAPAAAGRLLPARTRATLVAVGAVQLLAALVWFAVPGRFTHVAPWALTPLTARTLSAFVAFTGSLLVWSLVDRRWKALQFGVEAVTVGLALTALGLLRAHRDFTGPAVARGGYGLSLAALLALAAWLQLDMARAPRPPRPAPRREG